MSSLVTERRPAPADPVPIDAFTGAPDGETPAAQLRRIREQAPAFKEAVKASGEATAFVTRSLITLPYPRRYALWDACSLPVPYVWFTNRMFVVQWQDEDGITRTLLAEPSDFELGYDTPYFRWEYEHVRDTFGKRVADSMVTRHAHVTQVLEGLGIRAEDVDYVSFDHLHTQDIRRIVGTTRPAPDLDSPNEPLEPIFPNAKLVLRREELDHVRDVHPFQARFHQAHAYGDIREENLLFVDRDVLLGPGVAIMGTPGHTLGNQTLVVNAPGRGLFTSSENGVAVECYAPRHSKLPGVAKWAERWGFDVVMNFNTPEYASWQYNSMVKEQLVADPIPTHPHFSQVAPSSELTRHRLAPGVRPTYEHGDLTLGRVQRST